MDDFVMFGAVLGVIAAVVVLAAVWVISGRIESTSRDKDR